jgi:GNAT superfamily N-acetyltransferase
MWWKQTRAQFAKQKGVNNKKAFKRIVQSGATPGLLAYADGEPVGWCAVARRQSYPRLENSRTLSRVDGRPVWSVVCFYVMKGFRRQGVTRVLLNGAIEYARKRGARIVEGYPVTSKTNFMPDAFAWTGFENAFRKAGFKEVARRSPTRPIMRRMLGDS